MDLRVAPDVRQILVDLDDHHIRRLKECLLMDEAQGDLHVSVPVHGSSGGDEDVHVVDAHPPGGTVVQVRGIVVQGAGGVAAPGIPHEEGHVHIEGVVILGVQHELMRQKAHGPVHFDGADLSVEGVHGVKDGCGLVGALAGTDDVPGFQLGQRLLQGDELPPILLLITGHCAFSFR